SATSGAPGRPSPAPSSERSCSTTSRSSTTANDTNDDSATAPPPRPTLPAQQPDLPKPRVHQNGATPERRAAERGDTPSTGLCPTTQARRDNEQVRRSPYSRSWQSLHSQRWARA